MPRPHLTKLGAAILRIGFGGQVLGEWDPLVGGMPNRVKEVSESEAR